MSGAVIRRRLVAAALCALFLGVAVVGGAEAGSLVTGKRIKDGSVRGIDLRDGSVTGRDVAGISGRDYLGEIVGPPGSVGLRGPSGPSGAAGAAGPAGIRGIVTRTSAGVSVGAGLLVPVSVTCPTGTMALGGGLSAAGTPGSIRLLNSAPANNNAGWDAIARNQGGAPQTLYAWAVCAESGTIG